MTDHADTIRRKITAADVKMVCQWALDLAAQRDALLAERQQAQDKLWEQSEAAANLVIEVERLEAERQQAIDALREARRPGEARGAAVNARWKSPE